MDREILIHELRQCGVQGKLLKWIEQFLTNKKQFVTINCFHSNLALVLSGVPQGSVLGPILYLVYINDLKGSTAGSFADDTRLSKQISSCDDVLILQEDLNTVVKWATENSKFEYLAYRTASSKLLEELPFTGQWVHYSAPSGQDLAPASSVKDLGVHLSPDIKWSLQATIAAQNANKMANWVLSVFSERSKDVLLSPYPLQEYCELSVADSNTPVQYGIHPQCKTSRNWNPPNVLSLATLVDVRVCHIGTG